MDFGLSEEQQAVGELAGRILTRAAAAPSGCGRSSSTDVVVRRPTSGSELAKAELLGLCLPEDVGGSGYGILEACLLLEQQGRAVAPLPLLPTLVYGALPVAQFGTDEQRASLLPGVASGDTILTAALHESGTVRGDDPADGRWRLDGECPFVPAAAPRGPGARAGANGRGHGRRLPRRPGRPRRVVLARPIVTTGEPQWTLTPRRRGVVRGRGARRPRAR